MGPLRLLCSLLFKMPSLAVGQGLVTFQLVLDVGQDLLGVGVRATIRMPEFEQKETEGTEISALLRFLCWLLFKRKTPGAYVCAGRRPRGCRIGQLSVVRGPWSVVSCQWSAGIRSGCVGFGLGF
jgi:hypothetical protein